MAGLLADYGVTAVFGVPGGQTLPLYYGILDEGNRIRHILMKDESDATFAADAYARISGGIGVCDATAGCGAIKFISGLAEAYNTSIPVIAIGSEMEGEWRADGPQTCRYEVYEKEHEIRGEYWGGFTRHNTLFRRVLGMDGAELGEDFITENHVFL